MKRSRLSIFQRVFGGLLAACLTGALTIAVAPPASATDTDQTCSDVALQCIGFVDHWGNYLHASDDGRWFGYDALTGGTQFQIVPNTDSSVQIRQVGNTGWCLTADSGYYSDGRGLVRGDWAQSLRTCSTDASAQYYFSPVNSLDTSGNGWFTIRDTRTNKCLDEQFGDQRTTDTFSQTEHYTCNGALHQQWKFIHNTPYNDAGGSGRLLQPSPSTELLANALAVNYQQTLCSADTTQCTYTGGTVGAPVVQPTTCYSPAVFNSSSSNVAATSGSSDQTGWSNTIGWKIGVEVETGTVTSFAVKVKASVEASGSHVWSGASSKSFDVSGIVPPQQYGWFTLGVVSTPVTATWTFLGSAASGTNSSWSATDTINVPVISGNAGSPGTVVTFHQSTSPPVCSGVNNNSPAISIASSISAHTRAGVSVGAYSSTIVADVLTYSWTVSNPGNVTLTGVGVSTSFGDSNTATLKVTCPLTTLKPGDIENCTANGYTVTPADGTNQYVIMKSNAYASTATGASIFIAGGDLQTPIQASAASTSRVPERAGVYYRGADLGNLTGNIKPSTLCLGDTTSATADLETCGVPKSSGGGKNSSANVRNQSSSGGGGTGGSSAANQTWTYNYSDLSLKVTIAGVTSCLVNAASGSVAATLAACDQTIGQQWFFSTRFNFVNVSSGKALEAVNAAVSVTRTAVTVSPVDNSAAQIWSIG